MESSLPISYFSGGPAKIPNEVLNKVSADVLKYQDTGVGVLEISHRSPAYLDILRRAKQSVVDILEVPANYKVLFVPGGGTGQFAAIPLNLMGKTGTADYIVTGAWSRQAAAEASKYGTVRKVHGDWAICGGEPSSLAPEEGASYLFYCDNETIEGVEFSTIPEAPPGVPLVCDMSSNICSRKVDISKFGLIFAGAQKNIGCAGVTLVIIREDLLKTGKLPYCPIILDYSNITLKDSNYNTPPVYAIHVLAETLAWAEREGGLQVMGDRSDQKSALLYSAIDGSKGFYCNSVDPKYRSRVNVVFTIGAGDAKSADLEAKFVAQAAKENLLALKGHRSVGGMRASLFNAITMSDVERLVKFMDNFRTA